MPKRPRVPSETRKPQVAVRLDRRARADEDDGRRADEAAGARAQGRIDASAVRATFAEFASLGPWNRG
jgi:hypothetical protein